MRPDAKVEGPRQSMSWLHTWASLILGWLLYAIFLTGTLSFFQSEITVWMKPELHQSIPPASQQQQFQVALNYLQQQHPNAGSWMIQLPNLRQNTTLVNIRQVGEDPRARRGGTRITLDSQTGEVLESRETRGGGFLYRFHFELYGMPRTWARWIVGIATLFMLVAIVSGIITHKKIFKDFFSFRSKKGQRSWLDAHNATAVLALPFHIMITLSGLLLLLFTIMPWGVTQVYESRQQFLQEQRKSLVESSPENTKQSKAGMAQIDPRHESSMRTHSRNGSQDAGLRRQAGQRQSGERRQPRKEIPLQAAPLADLTPILTYAQQQWKHNSIGSINIISPNTEQAQIVLQALYSPSVAYRNIYDTLTFNAVTGQQIKDEQRLATPSVPAGIYNVVTVLHEARGVELALRWLLFFSGVVGTLMVATGLILWCVKRAPQQFKQGQKSFGYRLVEVTNIAAIIGLPIACAAYFYANRLIPADMAMRLNWEIRTFFMIWILSLIHACLRQHKQAWLEQLLFAAIAFALLPIINFITGGQPLWASISHAQWMIASFDLAMWIMALICIFAFMKVKNHQHINTKKAKAATATLSQESQA